MMVLTFNLVGKNKKIKRRKRKGEKRKKEKRFEKLYILRENEEYLDARL
jgi:hypothetical protein